MTQWREPGARVDCFGYVFELAWLRVVSPHLVAKLPPIAQGALVSQPVAAYFLVLRDGCREREEAFSAADVETAVRLAMQQLAGLQPRWIVMACPATEARVLATLGHSVPVWGTGRA